MDPKLLPAESTDVFISIKSLSPAEDGVITEIAAIPFDVATGVYLGMENEDGQPTDVYLACPNIQEQMDDYDAKITEERMLELINKVSDDGHLPVWADDPTGSIWDAMIELQDWLYLRTHEDSSRLWFEDCEAQKQFVAAMLACADDEEAPLVWAHTLKQEILSAVHPGLKSVFEHIESEAPGDSVQDALAGLKKASACWEVMHPE
jgi:hypothetical protein